MSREINPKREYCWVTGCVKPWVATTSRIGVKMRLCGGHKSALYRTGTLIIDIGTLEHCPPEVTLCQVAKCRNRPITAKLVDGERVWVCGTHRTRWDKHGSFNVVYKPYDLAKNGDMTSKS